jgi:hypothetical protein
MGIVPPTIHSSCWRCAVARRLGCRHALGIGGAEKRKVLRQHDEVGSRRRSLGQQLGRGLEIALDVAAAGHLGGSGDQLATWLVVCGGNAAQSSSRSSWSLLRRSTVGSSQLPVMQ